MAIEGPFRRHARPNIEGGAIDGPGKSELTTRGEEGARTREFQAI